MRFNKLDLNLLVALDAMLTECSISRAAERLFMSQSAMSNSLARLRAYFDDELLVQVGRRMELTPRAETLRDAVRDVLVRIDSSLAARPSFDAAKSDRVFRVMASDFTQSVLGPHVLAVANEQRASVSFQFLPQVQNPQRPLERGETDLLIIPHGFESGDHPSVTLFEETFECVVWTGSPLARQALTLPRYLAARHVVMQPAGTAMSSVEALSVKNLGLVRQVALTTYSFMTIPPLVVGTDYIGTVHSRLARRAEATLPIKLMAPPLQLPKMDQMMQWHKYHTNDPGMVWLMATMQSAARRMDSTDF